MDIYKNLNKMNLILPAPPAKGGIYCSAKRFGGHLVYISGCGPVLDTGVKGKLGKEFGVEEGAVYARNCVLNVLAVLQDLIGDLNKVKNVVKILCFVAGESDFFLQADVANGASRLLVDLFGPEVGTPSRSAIGVNALPGNIPVEIEAIFEVDE